MNFPRLSTLAALLCTGLLSACATPSAPPESGIIQETNDTASVLKKADLKKADTAQRAAEKSGVCHDLIAPWNDLTERTTTLNVGTITPDMSNKENDILSTGDTTNGIFVNGPINVDHDTGEITIDADIEMFSKHDSCAPQKEKDGHQIITLKHGDKKTIMFNGYYVGTLRA
mgnify:CR=1 FL=1